MAYPNVPVYLRLLQNQPILALLLVTATAGCSAKAQDHSGDPARYLYVWAGPHRSHSMADTAHNEEADVSDFVAVLDGDPTSAAYGNVITATGTPAAGAMAHHTEFTLPAGHPLFANDYTTGKVFLIDLANPLRPRVAGRIDSIPGFRRPHSFARLANGHVLVSMQFGSGTLPGDPGGLAEFDAAGQLVRTASSADSAFPGAHIRTYGLEVLPAIDRAVTTSSPMDASERTADVIQVWRLSDLRLLKTISMPAVAGDSVHRYPFEIRALPDGRTAFLNTYYCGFYLLSGLATDEPEVRFVYSIREPARIGCGVPVVVGRFWVMPVAYDHSVVALDLADPAHPVRASVLRADPTYMPHWSSADPGSDRIVITGQDDGDARVLIARLDRATGKLSWDERFRDQGSGRLGIGFDRRTWPHGVVSNARPHGALFGR